MRILAGFFDLEGEDGFRKREERIINELTQMQRYCPFNWWWRSAFKENRNYLSARGIVIYLGNNGGKTIPTHST